MPSMNRRGLLKSLVGLPVLAVVGRGLSSNMLPQDTPVTGRRRISEGLPQATLDNWSTGANATITVSSVRTRFGSQLADVIAASNEAEVQRKLREMSDA